MKKKNKSKIKYVGVGLLIIILGIVSMQFFSLYSEETFTSKYNFKDNEVDLRKNNIRIAPVLYSYSGNQLNWDWFNSNRQGILPVYGSISSKYIIEGDITNKYNASLISYGVKDSNNYYCQELGHSGAYSMQSSQSKGSSVFERDREGCDKTTDDYPLDCTYWRKESYDSYYATKIWCYNNGAYLKYTKFQTEEPTILDGYYNTFRLKYNATLNNQQVKPFIVINNVTYSLTNDRKEFEEVYAPNTKVYYGFEIVTDGTNTPIINNPKDIELISSFAEPEIKEQQGSIIEDSKEETIYDTIEDVIKSNVTSSLSNESVDTEVVSEETIQVEEERSYSTIISIGIAFFIILGVMYLKFKK